MPFIAVSLVMMKSPITTIRPVVTAFVTLPRFAPMITVMATIARTILTGLPVSQV
jgi:hypothetical protein